MLNEYIRELSSKDIEATKREIGLRCEECGSLESRKWYEEKLVKNCKPIYIYRLLCGKCSRQFTETETEDIVLGESVWVAGIVKPTNAELFKDLEIDDMIYLSVPVKCVGRNKGTYATYVTIEDYKRNVVVKKSFNQLSNLMSKFKWK